MSFLADYISMDKHTAIKAELERLMKKKKESSKNIVQVNQGIDAIVSVGKNVKTSMKKK
jgi:hypothetical protein